MTSPPSISRVGIVARSTRTRLSGRKISSMMVCLPTNSPLHDLEPIVRQTMSSWQASQKGAPLPWATCSKMVETSWALGEGEVMVGGPAEGSSAPLLLARYAVIVAIHLHAGTVLQKV